MGDPKELESNQEQATWEQEIKKAESVPNALRFLAEFVNNPDEVDQVLEALLQTQESEDPGFIETIARSVLLASPREAGFWLNRFIYDKPGNGVNPVYNFPPHTREGGRLMALVEVLNKFETEYRLLLSFDRISNGIASFVDEGGVPRCLNSMWARVLGTWKALVTQYRQYYPDARADGFISETDQLALDRLKGRFLSEFAEYLATKELANKARLWGEPKFIKL